MKVKKVKGNKISMAQLIAVFYAKDGYKFIKKNDSD